MKKRLRFFSVFLLIFCMISGTVFGYGNTVYMYRDKPLAKVYSSEYNISAMPVRYNKTNYFPVDDCLRVCGFNLGWDSTINAVTAAKGNIFAYIITNSNALWKNEYKYESQNSTLIVNDVFYMPQDMLEVLTDDKFIVSYYGAAEKAGKRDLLSDTYVSDKNRRSGEIFRFNNVAIAGNFGMMIEAISKDNTDGYIGALNMIANTVPNDVNIYNVIAPTSSEFYAPKEIYLNQTEAIRTVYENISQRIMPINAVKILDAHSNENIYFRTDHHWTQRGAFYAYRELMEVKGDEVPYLEDFQSSVTPFSGSIAEFAKGTYAEQVMLSNPESIEKFYPVHFTGGACYLDMYMKNYACSIEPVYYYSNSYLSFLGGDMPMIVMTSDVENGKKCLVLKESFGNAFSTWLLNNYSEIYVVDVRQFNNGGEAFKINDFYKFVKFDDLIIVNSASSFGIYENLRMVV